MDIVMLYATDAIFLQMKNKTTIMTSYSYFHNFLLIFSNEEDSSEKSAMRYSCKQFLIFLNVVFKICSNKSTVCLYAKKKHIHFI